LGIFHGYVSHNQVVLWIKQCQKRTTHVPGNGLYIPPPIKMVIFLRDGKHDSQFYHYPEGDGHPPAMKIDRESVPPNSIASSKGKKGN